MGRIPAQDPGEVAAAAAKAATADALAKVATAQAEKQASEAVLPLGEKGEAGGATDALGQSARFFVRGLGSLGEHHLKDYFDKFGQVVEASLVRDKKTQRPRGMAFVSLAPKAPEGGGPTPSLDELIERVAGADSHSIKGVEVEVQEALPKPAEEKVEETEKSEQKPSAGDLPPPPQVESLPAVDPVAQAKAQAQWQMHYLAMAINLSVPDLGKGGGKDGGSGKGRPAPY
ncbi:unnamed protein product [Durusdinium trenchii]|uniref:RRM domain-containing protein n=2 Tax=Durusdinium trenchii TaxID=1381693 RepID=A0ABP0L930_9DINO